jgi:hypothetical protein
MFSLVHISLSAVYIIMVRFTRYTRLQIDKLGGWFEKGV